MQDEAKVLKMLMMTAEVLKGTLSATAQDAYLTTLQPYSDDAICEALNRCTRECKFFPVPAEIIERIEGPRATRKEQAAIAWAEMLNAVKKYGTYKSINFADRNIMAAIRAMGGWTKVGEWQEDEMNWRQKEFCEFYCALSEAQAPDYLPGRVEIANRGNGYDFEQPVFIGNPPVKAIPAPYKSDIVLLKEIIDRAGL